MRNEEPTKWLEEMPKRVLPERQSAVAKPSALDPIRNCEAIDEVLKRTSPAGRCATPKASKTFVN